MAWTLCSFWSLSPALWPSVLWFGSILWGLSPLFDSSFSPSVPLPNLPWTLNICHNFRAFDKWELWVYVCALSTFPLGGFPGSLNDSPSFWCSLWGTNPIHPLPLPHLRLCTIMPSGRVFQFMLGWSGFRLLTVVFQRHPANWGLRNSLLPQCIMTLFFITSTKQSLLVCWLIGSEQNS